MIASQDGEGAVSPPFDMDEISKALRKLKLKHCGALEKLLKADYTGMPSEIGLRCGVSGQCNE